MPPIRVWAACDLLLYRLGWLRRDFTHHRFVFRFRSRVRDIKSSRSAFWQTSVGVERRHYVFSQQAKIVLDCRGETLAADQEHQMGALGMFFRRLLVFSVS